MKKRYITRLFAFFVCFMMLFVCACSNQAETEAPVDTSPTGIGSGAVFFPFTATDADGNTENFNVYTDKKTVGEALIDAGLIDGEQGPYGLYVKTVNGATYDYDTHGKYWAFYIDGELALSGVDTTEIESGKTYSFKAQK